jgi:hypothetical protein
MKITTSTETKLEVINNQIAVLLISFLFLTVGILLKTNPELFEQVPPKQFSTFLICGGLLSIALFYSHTQLLLNKETNSMCIKRMAIIGYLNKCYPLDQVNSVHYRINWQGRRSARIEFKMNDNSVIPLTLTKSQAKYNNDREIVNAIANFLKIKNEQDQIGDQTEGGTIFHR